MTITKAGDTTKLTADRDFICIWCGCEFTATSSEYQLPDYPEIGMYNVDSMCKCPTCENITFKFRDKLSG